MFHIKRAPNLTKRLPRYIINKKTAYCFAISIENIKPVRKTIPIKPAKIGFKSIFSRPLSSLGKNGDVLIAISTSGNSKNIINVLKVAKKKEVFSIAFLGAGGGVAKKYADLSIIVGSKITARIQEAHIFLGHFIFENVEDFILKRKNK